MLTDADVCGRMLTYAESVATAANSPGSARGIYRRMRTYADGCGRMLTYADVYRRMLTYADVCGRMLMYADVCGRMLTCAESDATAAYSPGSKRGLVSSKEV